MKQSMKQNPPVAVSNGLHLVTVRLPHELHQRLVEDAGKRKRSVNAQINLLIEEHLERVA